ncbi:hypothetical protein [Lacihabitans sp. CS3-21]|nr:hypothetical protein [Lacihabitans sp. CS3-21]
MKIEGHLFIIGFAKVIYFSFANVKPKVLCLIEPAKNAKILEAERAF